MVIRALHDGIHRHGHATAGAKYTTKLGESPHRVGEEHQSEIAQYGIETAICERKRLPILHRDWNIRRFAKTLTRLLGHGRRDIAAMIRPVGPMAARAASAESPVPVAMSRACIPGATWAARNRKGMKYAVTCAKARSYSAAASSLKTSSSAILKTPILVLCLPDGMFA
jgi:hypothetical protein